MTGAESTWITFSCRTSLIAAAMGVALCGSRVVWAQGAVRPPAAGAAAASAGRPPIEDRLVKVDVHLNKRALGAWTVLERNGNWFAAVQDLDVWRVKRTPGVAAIGERGSFWYPLSALPGSEVRVALAEGRLDLQVSPSALLPGSLPPLDAQAPATGAADSSGARAHSSRLGHAPTQRFLPMDVSVNGARSGNWVLLEANGALFAPAEAFDEWRVSRDPQVKALELRGQSWYPLSSVPGFASRIDFASQSIELRFSPKAFAATRITQERDARPPLTPSIPAGFLNYDLNLQTQAVRGLPLSKDLGALVDLGFSNALGVFTSNYSGTGLIQSNAVPGAGWRRLETTFSRDLPERNLTLRIGDASTRQAIGGRSVYFGGFQIGTNFGLTPGFISQPVPVLAGVSSAPSTVELYVNDALRQTSRVPTGPFAIDNFPLLTGSGEARIVVRDLLGRETVLVQDFFNHSSLLRKGLSDWSFELGSVRRNIGVANAEYGRSFASGLYRLGLSGTSTLESRAEVARSSRVFGLGIDQVLPAQVLGQLAVARSSDAAMGGGSLLSAGVERQSLQHGFTARVEGATRGYTQLGQERGTLHLKWQQSASYNYGDAAWGNWGLAVARIVRFDDGPLTTVSLNYSRKVGRDSALAVTLTKVSGSSSGTAVGVSLVIPLGGGMTSSSSLTRHDGQMDAYTSINNALTQETGLGYRALAGTRGGQAYSEGGVYYQGGRALLTADTSVSSEQQTVRLGARGGLALVDGRFFAARQLEGSFAEVEVPGYPGVGVGFQGSTITKTDASGVAILPRLSPYTANSIRLDPRELPINAEIDNIEQVAVPAARSAVKVVFPVRTGRAALIKLVLDDGEPAPAGADIELVGDKHEFFVARRGETFVTGMKTDNVIRLKYGGQSCAVNVSLPPPTQDDIVRIGPLTCSGVKR